MGSSEICKGLFKIHQCLWFDEDEDERRDAHGVTGGAVTNLTIKDTEIHTFSGDAIQFDPGRWEPGWNDIHISGCKLWLEPLAVEHILSILCLRRRRGQ